MQRNYENTTAAADPVLIGLHIFAKKLAAKRAPQKQACLMLQEDIVSLENQVNTDNLSSIMAGWGKSRINDADLYFQEGAVLERQNPLKTKHHKH